MDPSTVEAPEESESESESVARLQGLRGIFEGLTVGVAWFDADGRVAGPTTRLSRTCSGTRATSSRAASPPSSRRRTTPKIASSSRSSSPATSIITSIERRYLRRDGQPMWGLLTVSLGESARSPRPVIRVIDDITDRRRAQERVAAQHDRRADSWRARPR